MNGQRWRGFVSGLLLAASMPKADAGNWLMAIFLIVLSMVILFEGDQPVEYEEPDESQQGEEGK